MNKAKGKFHRDRTEVMGRHSLKTQLMDGVKRRECVLEGTVERRVQPKENEAWRRLSQRF